MSIDPRVVRLGSLALVPALAWLALRQAGPDLVPLAGTTGTGELAFEVRERGAGAIPSRLTFVPEAGGTRALFTHPGAAPRDFAARDDVVYTRTGAGRISVPPGRYTVYASRGLEWSLASAPLALAAGEKAKLAFELVHELDTRGWISGDFHLHTLTYSGHGDANLEERVLSFLGEGLDFAVASDHDHNTDYRPTLKSLGIEGDVACVTGDEVTTPIGHFNAFPLDPARAPIDSSLRDANALFRLLRGETNAFGVLPVIQLNHPRLRGIDCFTRTGLDPVTGKSTDPAYGRDFDALEVLNENLALGYHDPLADHVDTHGHLHSAVVDWFHLLNQGERYAAVGNSDSHTVRATLCGYPRNFVRVEHDDPAHASAAEIATAVRAKQLFTTTGPFVELGVAGASMGSEARLTDGHARLSLRVRAASWIDCDRAKVFVNGELVATLPIPDTRAVLRLETELELCFLGTCARHGHAQPAAPGAYDGWVVVVVEGDDSLAPVLAAEARPLALTNPVWVDGDGDGRWTSPRERIATEIAQQPTPALALDWFGTLAPEEQALALANVPRGPFAAVLIDAGLVSDRRPVRLAAARAAEHHALPGALPGVQRAWMEDKDDAFLGALLVRVLTRGRPADGPASLRGFVKRFGTAAVRDYQEELLPLFPGGDVARWSVLGPLDATSGARAKESPIAERAPAGLASPGGRALAWQELASGPRGFVDLAGLGGEATEHTVVYAQAYVHSAEAREVLCAFGSDDGGRLWLNDRLLYGNPSAKSADPLETLLTLPLRPGWNRLVVEVENQTGGFGFYCRLLDPGVETASTPR